jgi:hypothetical protein
MRNSVPRKKFLEKLPKNGIIAEIGVASGEHAISMMDISSPKKIFLIDPWLPSFNPNYESKVMSEIANLGVSIMSKNDYRENRLKRYGIKKAVDEFVKANNLKIAFRSSGNDWAVQKK